MKRIIKLKQEDKVPNGAKFLHAKEEREFTRYSVVIYDDIFTFLTLGIGGSAIEKRPKYKSVTYFYYEIET